MRIAVWHDLPAGGARRALQELTRRLATKHSIHSYLIDPPPPGHALIGGEGNPATPIHYRPRPPRRYLFLWNDWLAYRDALALSEVERRVAKRIDEEGYDVALVSTLRGAVAPSITQHLSTPCVYYCHEPPRRFYEQRARPQALPLSVYERLRLYAHYPTQSLLDAYYRQEDVKRVQAASLVLTNSKYTQSRIKDIYGRSARVSYLGVDAEQFRPDDDNGKRNLVLSVGRFEPHKGFEFIIRALGQLPASERPRLGLAGAGGHPRMPDHLGSLAGSLGVQVEFHREISDAQLIDLYHSARVFLFAPHFEPFGLVVLEAMACELPVVAVDEGGVHESVRHGVTGYLVERSPQAFAEAVSDLLSSSEKRGRLGTAGRRAVERRWTWEQAADSLENHLLEAAA